MKTCHKFILTIRKMDQKVCTKYSGLSCKLYSSKFLQQVIMACNQTKNAFMKIPIQIT